MKVVGKLVSRGGIAGLLLGSVAAVALAAGMWGNWPVAGGSQYSDTLPLTGLENIPMDTNRPNGRAPQSQVATYAQLMQGSIRSAANVASFTAGVSAVDGGENLTLLLTGAISSGATLTTPTAAQIIAALPSGAAAGYSYLLKFVNTGGTGSGIWTIAGGSNVTVTGNATVGVGESRQYLVTYVSATSVTLQDLGN